MRILFIVVISIIFLIAIFSFYITRDGKIVTPMGEGTITLGSGTYENFPLPDYAAEMVLDNYKSYFIEVEPGIKVHILEVGQGLPIFLMHGNPTSGFLYRKVADRLPLDKVRVIMPTAIGLGFSSKIPASHHTLDNHIRWINKVLNELELNAPKEKVDLTSMHARVKTPIIGELFVEILFNPFEQLARVQGDPSSWSDEIIKLYGKPVFDSGNSKATLSMMRMVPDGPDHRDAAAMRKIEEYVKTLQIPVEIVWGMKDPLLGKGLSAMEKNFPDAPVTKTQAGHFIQEEASSEIANALIRVIDKVERN